MEVSSDEVGGGCGGGGGECTYKPGIYTELPPGVVPRADYDTYYRNIPAYGGSQGSQGVQGIQGSRRTTSDAASQLVIRAYVSDLTKVVGRDSRIRDNRVGLHIRRRNKVVTLQYEAFSGQLAANGIKYVSLGTSTTSKPISPTEETIVVEYNGVRRVGYIRIDPSDVDEIQFHFDLNDCLDVKMGDTVTFSGKAIDWITEVD